jgi:hypothetical protein
MEPEAWEGFDTNDRDDDTPFWMGYYGAFVPMAGNPENEYEWNSRIAEHLGNVEVGVSDIDSVTSSVPEGSIEKCPICLDNNVINLRVKTLCGHVYCKGCIHEWLMRHKKCPICNEDLQDLLEKKIRDSRRKPREEEEAVSDPLQDVIKTTDTDEYPGRGSWSQDATTLSTIVK